MRGKFVDLASGRDLQLVSSPGERDRFARYCRRERLRCGLLRVDEDGIAVEQAVLEG